MFSGLDSVAPDATVPFFALGTSFRIEAVLSLTKPCVHFYWSLHPDLMQHMNWKTVPRREYERTYTTMKKTVDMGML